jgi:outer membrane lipase/esterase
MWEGEPADEASIFNRFGIFLNGQGTFGNQDATRREPGFGFHTAGMTAGFDYRFTEQFILGIAGGYVLDQSISMPLPESSRPKVGSDSLFGTYYIAEQWHVDFIGTYGWNGYERKRNVFVDGVSATAKGDSNGRQRAVSVSGGYDFSVFKPLTIGLLLASITSTWTSIRSRRKGRDCST